MWWCRVSLTVEEHVLPVLGEHGSGQGVRRSVVYQLQHLSVVLLRVNINGQNRPKDFLHKTQTRWNNTESIISEVLFEEQILFSVNTRNEYLWWATEPHLGFWFGIIRLAAYQFFWSMLNLVCLRSRKPGTRTSHGGPKPENWTNVLAFHPFEMMTDRLLARRLTADSNRVSPCLFLFALRAQKARLLLPHRKLIRNQTDQ